MSVQTWGLISRYLWCTHYYCGLVRLLLLLLLQWVDDGRLTSVRREENLRSEI